MLSSHAWRGAALSGVAAWAEAEGDTGTLAWAAGALCCSPAVTAPAAAGGDGG